MKKLLVVLTAGLLLAAADAKKDLERMQGTWLVVANEVDGQRAPEAEIKKADLRLTIQGNSFTYTAGGKPVLEGSFTIDPAKKPKHLDAKGTLPNGTMTKSIGIYELDGDTMRVCFVEGQGERPKEFKTAPGSNAILTVYKRVKP